MVNFQAICAEESTTLAEKLFQHYDGITSITCEIRKTIQSNEGTMRMLSRVFFEKPDRLNVENISPMKRRIVADGTHIYYYEEGAKVGFSSAIENLSDLWLNSLRNIPGSPLLYVAKIRNTPEIHMPASEIYPTRKAYDNGKTFIVLSCDSTHRLMRIDVFTDPQQQKLSASYLFEDFQEIAPDCFLPCKHTVQTFFPDGSTAREVSFFKVLSVNKPISANLFNSTVYLKGIRFSPNFPDVFDRDE